MIDPTSDYLRLDIRPAADVGRVRVTLRGELDSQTARGLVRAVTELLDQPHLDRPHIDRIRLDLAGLTFIDAAGIRALLQCEAAARHTGIRLELRRATPAVVRILDIVGLTRHFGLHPATGDAPEADPAPDDEGDELLAGSLRARGDAHDICRRPQEAVRQSSRMRDV